MECKQRSVSDISDAGQMVAQLHCGIYPTWGSEGVKDVKITPEEVEKKTQET